jgi:shikimate dehydrogenase
MHRAALEAAGLEGSYEPIEARAESLGALLNDLRDKGFDGLNVTAPLKQAVIPCLLNVSPEAEAIGAVNTLILTSEGYIGHNTDAAGFSEAYLTSGFSRSLILGAGGAARAVCQAFRNKALPDSDIVLTSRRPKAGRELSEEFNLKFSPAEDLIKCGFFDLAVNATSASSPSELGDFLPKPQIASSNGRVVDINYSRPVNYWRELALKAGAGFSDGFAMLAHQARLSFILWTHLDPSLEPFSATLKNWAASPA